METQAEYIHGGLESPREIIQRIIAVLQGALEVGQLEDAEVLQALCDMVREELKDLERARPGAQWVVLRRPSMAKVIERYDVTGWSDMQVAELLVMRQQCAIGELRITVETEALDGDPSDAAEQ